MVWEACVISGWTYSLPRVMVTVPYIQIHSWRYEMMSSNSSLQKFSNIKLANSILFLVSFSTYFFLNFSFVCMLFNSICFHDFYCKGRNCQSWDFVFDIQIAVSILNTDFTSLGFLSFQCGNIVTKTHLRPRTASLKLLNGFWGQVAKPSVPEPWVSFPYQSMNSTKADVI